MQQGYDVEKRQLVERQSAQIRKISRQQIDALVGEVCELKLLLQSKQVIMDEAMPESFANARLAYLSVFFNHAMHE